MWAVPRKPGTPMSPYNSRALLCADHKAKLYATAVRRAICRSCKTLLLVSNQAQ